MTSDDDEYPTATVHRLPKNPWSIAGLHKLEDLPERQVGETWKTGFFDWTGKVALAPGTVSVVTGMPGSGKSHLWAQVWNYVVGRYGFAAMIASFECPPKPYFRRYLREFFARCRESQMDEKQLSEADRFIDDHYRFLIHPDETPDLDWFLDMAELAVTREGVKVIQLDPWNRLESQREAKESESDYVARCLRRLTVFAKDMGCHVQVVAHPAKRDGRRRDIPPDLEDISGSAHWFNMPDQGSVMHREKLWTKDGGRCFEATFYHRKARFEELGYPCALNIRFNWQTRVFESVTDQPSGSQTRVDESVA